MKLTESTFRANVGQDDCPSALGLTLVRDSSKGFSYICLVTCNLKCETRRRQVGLYLTVPFSVKRELAFLAKLVGLEYLGIVSYGLQCKVYM